MLSISPSTLTDLIATYGYLAVFIGVGIESMGVPFPGETTLLIAAIYAGGTHHLSIAGVIIAAAAGAITGDNLGYLIGREGGFRLLARFGHRVRLTERRLKLGQFLFLRHGGKVVFFGRFISILRTWAAFLAGVNRMPWRSFVVYNGLGGAIWATFFGVGGYILGSNIYRLSSAVGTVVGIVAVLAVIGIIILVWRNEQRLADEAERALPGPIERYYAGGPTQPRAPLPEER